MKIFNVGIVAMAAKPPHAGHVKLIELAAAECDVAYVFVSTADRARPGELEVRWEDVWPTWRDDINPSLPSNVKFSASAETPVRRAYELVESADKSWKIALYGRPDDLKRFEHMPKSVKIRDVNLGAYSGTACRDAVVSGDFKKFKSMMAPCVDATALWERLRARAGSVKVSAPQRGSRRRS